MWNCREKQYKLLIVNASAQAPIRHDVLRAYGGKIEMREPPVEEIVRKIVSEVHPQRVILFGSLARGEGRTDSDADILVEMETDLKPFERRQADDQSSDSGIGPWTFLFTRPKRWNGLETLSGRLYIRWLGRGASSMKGAESNWHSCVLKAENDLLSTDVRHPEDLAGPGEVEGRAQWPRHSGSLTPSVSGPSWAEPSLNGNCRARNPCQRDFVSGVCAARLFQTWSRSTSLPADRFRGRRHDLFKWSLSFWAADFSCSGS